MYQKGNKELKVLMLYQGGYDMKNLISKRRNLLWQFCAYVNVLRHHAQLTNRDAVLLRDSAQNFLAKLFIFLLPKHLKPVLRAPLQMVYVHTDFVREFLYFHTARPPASKELTLTSEGLVRGATIRSPRNFMTTTKEKRCAIHPSR